MHTVYCVFIDKLKECIDLKAPVEITHIPYKNNKITVGDREF